MENHKEVKNPNILSTSYTNNDINIELPFYRIRDIIICRKFSQLMVSKLTPIKNQ